MQKKTSNFIFSLMLVSSWQIMAQEVVRKDSVRRVFAPTGIRIGLDAIGIIKTFSRDDFKGWELQADMDLRNYYVAVEAGHWQRDVVLENGNYTNNGNYFRIGADVNFLKKDPEKNMFFIGFRIGHS